MTIGLNDMEESRRQVTNGFRITLGVAGIIGIISGILIVAWPGATAAIITAIIAGYLVVMGIVYGASAFFSQGRSAGWRIGHILLAALFVIGGIAAFANLNATEAALAIVIGISIGVLWIVQGIVALTTMNFVRSRAWTIFFAVISILAGLVMFFSPVYGVAVLWVMVGVSAIFLGILQIIRAVQFGRQ